jgi:hypothetical protein
MDMQDKEFDKLFSNKLNDYEIEPSKAVWQGVNQELGGKKRRTMVPFLSIAASIIVLVAASIIFITYTGKTIKPVKPQLANNHPAKVAPAVTKASPIVEAPKATLMATSTVVKSQQVIKSKIQVNAASKQQAPVQQQIAVQSQQQPVLAMVPVSKNNVTVQPAAIDTTAKIAAVPVKIDKPATLVAIVPDKVKLVDTPRIKKHRVHTFGDMLNVVIAAVDKRKDKVIEFSNTDGDESSITGINLGIIKIKKEN